MAGNTFGKLFTLTSFGESHGVGIGGIVDGCPSGLHIDQDEIRKEMSRRKPGQSSITTQRKEEDEFEILSGLFENRTTGAPIAFLIRNSDYRPSDYDALKDVFRPSHADYSYFEKYGIRDHRGGGRSSARETAARVFAGAIAKQLLKSEGVNITAFVKQVGTISLDDNIDGLDLSVAETNAVRCPDPATAEKMIKFIEELKSVGDTTGGIVYCSISGTKPGWGEPVFDKLHADLGKAMLSINAAHGFEYGSGFKGAAMRGSFHNDSFIKNESGKIVTTTNNSGGIQGGISNGMNIYFQVAFKPVSTILQSQTTINNKGESVDVLPGGRHDSCVVPRAVPVVEAMAALVLADHFLRNRSAKL